MGGGVVVVCISSLRPALGCLTQPTKLPPGRFLGEKTVRSAILWISRESGPFRPPGGRFSSEDTGGLGRSWIVALGLQREGAVGWAQAAVGHLGRAGGEAAWGWRGGGLRALFAASGGASDPSQKLFGDPCPSGTQETGRGEGGGCAWWGRRKEAASCSTVTSLWGDGSPGLAETEPSKVRQAEPAGPVCAPSPPSALHALQG